MSIDLQQKAVDRITGLMKVGIGYIPAIGPLIAELVGNVIPNQRIDRIVRFVQLLDARVNEFKAGNVADRIHDAQFIDVMEDSFFQAAKAVSEERLQHIANVVARGIADEPVEYAQVKRMLWLLQQLTDEEVVLLRGCLPNDNVDYQADEPFQNLHSKVLKPLDESRLRTQRDLESNALHQSYRRHLSDLGLIDRTSVSVLGRMLLKFLELIPDWYRRPV